MPDDAAPSGGFDVGQFLSDNLSGLGDAFKSLGTLAQAAPQIKSAQQGLQVAQQAASDAVTTGGAVVAGTAEAGAKRVDASNANDAAIQSTFAGKTGDRSGIADITASAMQNALKLNDEINEHMRLSHIGILDSNDEKGGLGTPVLDYFKARMIDMPQLEGHIEADSADVSKQFEMAKELGGLASTAIRNNYVTEASVSSKNTEADLADSSVKALAQLQQFQEANARLGLGITNAFQTQDYQRASIDHMHQEEANSAQSLTLQGESLKVSQAHLALDTEREGYYTALKEIAINTKLQTEANNRIITDSVNQASSFLGNGKILPDGDVSAYNKLTAPVRESLLRIGTNLTTNSLNGGTGTQVAPTAAESYQLLQTAGVGANNLTLNNAVREVKNIENTVAAQYKQVNPGKDYYSLPSEERAQLLQTGIATKTKEQTLNRENSDTATFRALPVAGTLKLFDSKAGDPQLQDPAFAPIKTFLEGQLKIGNGASPLVGQHIASVLAKEVADKKIDPGKAADITQRFFLAVNQQINTTKGLGAIAMGAPLSNYNVPLASGLFGSRVRDMMDKATMQNYYTQVEKHRQQGGAISDQLLQGSGWMNN
jgi:hypothetical protein